jgi:hypothetical protein
MKLPEIPLRALELPTSESPSAASVPPTNEFHSYLGVNGWADFDGPVGAQNGMSPSEWKAFEAKVGTLRF